MASNQVSVVINIDGEVRRRKIGMEKMEYAPKGELVEVAKEVLDLLKQKELPVWQVKEVLREASRLAEWQTLK